VICGEFSTWKRVAAGRKDGRATTAEWMGTYPAIGQGKGSLSPQRRPPFRFNHFAASLLEFRENTTAKKGPKGA
jgi:hypothetical protein